MRHLFLTHRKGLVMPTQGMTIKMDYEDRQKQSKTLPPDLVQALWSEIKGLRDDAAHQAQNAKWQEHKLNDLLNRMKAAGMSDHLPTLDEARKAFRGE